MIMPRSSHQAKGPKAKSRIRTTAGRTTPERSDDVPTLRHEQRIEAPAGWRACQLGELLRAVDVRQADLTPVESASLEVLSLTKNHGLIPQSERFGKRIATDDVSKYKVVREGQIVYNPYVIWEGAVHALRKRPAGLVSPVYPVWEVAEPDGGFIDHLLRTQPLIDAYNRMCSGAVNRRRSIREDAFVGIRVIVPPVPERQGIAGVLQAVQQAKEAAEKVIGATRRLKQSLLNHLFTYGPVSFDQADQVVLKETEVGGLPESWAVISLGEITTLIQYGTSARCTLEPVGYPVLRIPNIVGGRVDTSALKYLSTSPAAVERHMLQSGDLLFVRTNAVRAYVGRCSVYRSIPDEALFASYLIRARVAPDQALPEYIQLFTETQKGRASFMERASGAADGKFNSTSSPFPVL